MKRVRILQSRFKKWWRACGFRGDWRRVFRSVVKKYSESHRAYHDLRHLSYCFEQFDRVSRKMQCPLVVEGALWFHDIEYDPHREDNEARSAVILRRLLSSSGVTLAFIGMMMRMIVKTRHTGMTLDPDTRLLLDIDLSILAAGEKLFSAYDAGIRIEYHFVPDVMYREGRMSVLRGLLDRSQIFQSAVLKKIFEKTARENLRVSIAKLGSGDDR